MEKKGVTCQDREKGEEMEMSICIVRVLRARSGRRIPPVKVQLV